MWLTIYKGAMDLELVLSLGAMSSREGFISACNVHVNREGVQNISSASGLKNRLS